MQTKFISTETLKQLQKYLDLFQTQYGEDKRIEDIIKMVDEEIAETENLRDESIRGDE